MGKVREALDKALVERKVSIKQVVRECDCSRSHFNKVISQQRKPSEKLVSRLSTSLNIPLSEMQKLIDADYSNVSTNESDVIKNREQSLLDISLFRSQIWLKRTLAITCLIFISIILLTFFDKPDLIVNGGVYKAIPDKLSPTIEGDDISFVADVTIPDGTVIPINSSYKKIWRIKNIGMIEWKGRYLSRITPISPNICSSPKRVQIPDTLPSKTVDVEVVISTPSIPGSCRTDWKMTDKDGELFFPDAYPLFSIVNVSK